MAGTLTITTPAADSQDGYDTSSITVGWRFDGVGTASQVQRRVTVSRSGSSTLLSDTGMQATTSTTFPAINLASGVYYTVTVFVLDTSGATTSASRVIVSRYQRSLPPEMTITLTDGAVVISIYNAVSGSRPVVTSNQVWRRAAGSTGAWSLVGTVGMNGVVVDREVRSGSSYDYFARGDADKNAQPAVGGVTGAGSVTGAVAVAFPPGGGATIGTGTTTGTVTTTSAAGGSSTANAAKVDSGRVDTDKVG